MEHPSQSIPTVMAERLFHIMGSVADFHIGMVLETGGEFDEERLLTALRRSIQLVPHLGRAFSPGPVSARLVPREAPDERLLGMKTTQDADHAEGTALDFLAQPLDVLSGPLVSGLLVRGETDLLALKVSHFAADAGGVKALCYLLAALYRDPSHGVEPFDRGVRRLWKRFSARKKLGVFRRMTEDLVAGGALPAPRTLAGSKAPVFGRSIIVRPLGQVAFEELTRWCRQRGATINDAAMAAFLLALERFTPEERGRVFKLIVTADLRRFLPPEERGGLVCNLSGWVPLNLGKNPGRTMGGAVALVSAKMTRAKNGPLGMGMMPPACLASRLPLGLCERAFRLVAPGLCARRLIAPSFTNMGVIDERPLDFKGIPLTGAFLTPPVVHAPAMGVGMSGYGGTLNLSMGVTSPGFDTRLCGDFLDAVINNLTVRRPEP